VRVGTGDDPATARLGETLWAFRRRTIPGQFRSAWRIECRRLGDESMRLGDPRLLRSRVVHGLAASLGLLAATAGGLGLVAALGLLLQAWQAIDLLETVNYFEHWGLSRAQRRVTALDSWDTDSPFTRPFQVLQRAADSPKLPFGYPPMVLLAAVWNSRFQALMTRELRRSGRSPGGATAE
jgi:alkane 1-monooxygenase